MFLCKGGVSNICCGMESFEGVSVSSQISKVGIEFCRRFSRGGLNFVAKNISNFFIQIFFIQIFSNGIQFSFK